MSSIHWPQVVGLIKRIEDKEYIQFLEASSKRVDHDRKTSKLFCLKKRDIGILEMEIDDDDYDDADDNDDNDGHRRRHHRHHHKPIEIL